MHAVIMAGGAGTRLRPLTNLIPKPMAPICGKPVIGHILDLLCRHGVTDAAVTLGYRAEVVTDYFRALENRWRGINLRFVTEASPLGTAGGVKNASGGITGDFIVISGDAMCDLDLSRAVRFHKETGADATLIVTETADPREYGLVRIDETGRVLGFIEKPGFPQAVSELCNTGIYILSPSVLRQIPGGEFSDFAADIFPKMLRTGGRIHAFRAQGFWCDIGDLSAYHHSAMAAISGAVSCEAAGERCPDGTIRWDNRNPDSATVLSPCYIGRDVTLQRGCVVMSSVLEAGSVVGKGARVFDSILLPGAVVADGESVTGSLVFPKEAGELTVPLAFSSHLAQYVAFEEESLSTTQPDITPELALKIGMALAEALDGGVVGLCSGYDPASKLLSESLRAGLLAGGLDVADVGPGVPGMLSYSQVRLGLPVSMMVESGGRLPVRVLGEGGLPVHRVVERAVERALRQHTPAPASKPGTAALLPGMGALYRRSLTEAGGDLSGLSVSVQSDEPACASMLEEVLIALGAGLRGELQLMLGGGGRTLGLAMAGRSLLTDEDTLVLCAMAALSRGEAVAVPYDAPQVLTMLASHGPGRLLRYRSCPIGHQDEEARKAAQDSPWVRDGMLRAVLLLGICAGQGKTPWELMRDIPSYRQKAASIPCDGTPAAMLRRLGAGMEAGEEGVILRSGGATARVTPNRRGTRLRLLVEANREEIADELFAELTRQLKSDPTVNA